MAPLLRRRGLAHRDVPEGIIVTPARDRCDVFATVPFAVVHAACLLVFWTGVSTAAVLACATMYAVRMFAITAGYHRYFSHASYKTSRAFQFVLAWLGASAAQKGPLWWASHHRHHHATSDGGDDVHSPVTGGLWWSHVGWIVSRRYVETNWPYVRQLARYPELRWINRYHLVPPMTLAAALCGFGEALRRWAPSAGTDARQILVWGFFVSTVLVYHATFAVNSIGHVYGTRRFRTPDESRNNLWIALFTFGEGWHNNHHFSPATERQGLLWWELDMTHCALVALSWLGLVWDLRPPPERISTGPERGRPDNRHNRHREFTHGHTSSLTQRSQP
jgi:stearoyl-CoA desaturase (Delta-9 desaturase)